jgi:cysteinyl-tRNA synthetase
MEPSRPDLRLQNTLTRRVEPLVPEAHDADGRPLLRFYSCGPTVYSYAHVGNFRTFLTADLVVRTAAALGWAVRYVSNITDVGHLTEDDVADASGEDRMAKALRSKEGEAFASVWDLARHYTATLEDDWRALNLREPDVRPRATEHVREQILATEQLVERGHAYETADGVYFHVPSFPGYGRLSGNTDAGQLTEGTRELVRDEGKKDPRDFALWKKDPHHLMQWHSPFGWGFPGWHLECSVMAMRYLGETIDLHGGGEDLRFPHHECEIAQSESLTGKPFAKSWVHTRFLLVEGQKMSKRLGNFLTVRELTQRPDAGGRDDWGAPLDPLALRYALMAGHYAKPLDLTREALHAAGKNVARFREADEAVRAALDAPLPHVPMPAEAEALTRELAAAYSEALAAMADDLHTPEALAAARRGADVVLAAGRAGTLPAAIPAARAFLDGVNALLGVVRSDYGAPPADAGEAAFAEEVEALLVERTEARAARDFARADAIRARLTALEVEVMDGPEGSTWRRKR